VRTISRRVSLRILLVCALSASFLLAASSLAFQSLPTQISDETFWQMIIEMSEPDGDFRFENFLSNELGYQYVIDRLQQRVGTGGVYIGVGPEQNFTYIAALEPKIAFIVDIRRQNMIEHLMYKALFEISSDRAEFVSRLFARRRPPGLDESSSPQALFRAYGVVPPDDGLYRETLKVMTDLLIRKHNLKLRPGDLTGYQSLDYVYSTFVESGPALDYSTGGLGAGQGNPTYEDLMVVDDGAGTQKSFLATEANYRIVRNMELKNLIVPLVGDFAGPKTVAAIGRYLKDHGAVVGAFYLSNVEQYLFQDLKNDRFYSNVAALPLDSRSTFIRTFSGRGFGGGFGGPYRFQSTLSSIPGVLSEHTAGRVRSVQDLRILSQ
jgi:hypothetical protein